MNKDENDKVEQPALDQLQRLGWDHVHGKQLSPEDSDERAYYSDVVLIKRLEASIQRLNPWINDENLRKIVRRIAKPQSTSLIETNQALWQSLTQYLSVEQDLGKGRRGQTVKVIDFDNPDNNEYLCTNQFKVSGVNQNIIPDIILFVNGLPLAVIECKSPFITNPMEAGIDQLLRYANRRTPHDDEGAEKLFHYNQMMVSTHRDKARVGTISSRMEHYLEWKDPYPFTLEQVLADNQTAGELKPDSQQVLIAGLFSKTNFLDIVQNFTVFEPTDGRVVKKIARYQQFRAVHKTIARIKTGKTRKERGGVIWHTQGSGKSLTMVFLTVKMRRDAELSQYKLVFITDRTQLDDQITATFARTQQETIHQAKSVSHLKELLAKDSSDVITAMVQKFQDSADDFNFPLLNDSHKIIVLADEAHRTQNGTLAMAINAALPNAPKIAFTGTPLIKSMKTNNEFGSYIDTYTIEQAVQDGATIQILYEGREAHVGVTGDSLDSLFDEYFGDRTDEEQAAIRKKFGNKAAVLSAPQRIRRVCIDILKHYREHIQPNGFKAMIVTASRHAAVLYKEMMDELEAPESAVIISGDHNDEKRFWEYTDGQKHKQQIEAFKKPLGHGEGQSGLSFLIVKDMLLTGFDAPIAQVMYLDKKLQDHNLLQTIARVNRTSKNKFKGYIVDYYGLSDYLTEALEVFSTEDVQGALTNFKEELPKLKAAHTRLVAHFKGLDLNELDECILSLSDEAKRQQFQTDFGRFAKQMDIVLPDASAKPFLGDLKRLGKIAHGARNLYRDEQLDIAGAGEKVRQLIEEHIYSTGVNPKIAPVDLLAQDFKAKLDEHKSDRSKASEVENAIKDHIKVNLEQDPEYYQALSKRLGEIIKQSEEKWDSLVQMLLEFRGTIESDRVQQATDIGLNETEFAFHNILMAEVSRLHDEAVDEATHQRVLEVVKKLVDMMKEDTAVVDFFNKWDEQKAMKKRIKRAILSEDFGTKELVEAINERFMDLAQAKFKAK
jgi:type I restriction enzyme, R subunit